jgi:4-diphosphocytidyl-2-C-methyl-D-erythritol kinase
VSIAHAKINLALVVGPLRPDGKHEVVTVLERVALGDTVIVERLPAEERVRVGGFGGDTIVSAALEALCRAAGGGASFSATIEKLIPLAAGLGGGSSDAAAALIQANRLLPQPVSDRGLLRIAADLGADVPFFLQRCPQLGSGDGSTLVPIELPRPYHVVLWLPDGYVKRSTADVYAAFDERSGADGFRARRDRLLEALAGVANARDLAALPKNDLASSPLVAALEEQGAFRADVTGAGPTIYGLFDDRDAALRAAEALRPRGRTWVTNPVAVE